MITSTQPSIYEQASHWVLRLRADDCTAAERQAFKDWLALDPTHLSTYQHAESVWQNFSQADQQANAQLASARALFRQALQQQQKKRSKRIATAASLLLAVGSAPFAWQWANTTLYTTLKGQRTEITLSDGSRIELNTDTQIRVNYAWQTRQVTLEHGEALFTVVHNPEKPFEVIAAKGIIRDIGTRFNVRQWHDETTVSVLEGEVAVTTETNTLAEHLQIGQQVQYNHQGRLSDLAKFDQKTVTAWQNDLLVFKKTPLSEVLDQLSRYQNVELTLADPALRDLKVSGDFPSKDLDGAINIITTALSIKAVRINQAAIMLTH